MKPLRKDEPSNDRDLSTRYWKDLQWGFREPGYRSRKENRAMSALRALRRRLRRVATKHDTAHQVKEEREDES